MGKEDNKYLLKFPQLADFHFSPYNKKIDCYPRSNISQETITHLLFNQVMPLVLTYKGKYFLHASAVAINTFGVAFMGKSGLGKSTLATSFGQKGFEVITDDSLLVEQKKDFFSVMPSPPQFRLWDESIDF